MLSYLKFTLLLTSVEHSSTNNNASQNSEGPNTLSVLATKPLDITCPQDTRAILHGSTKSSAEGFKVHQKQSQSRHFVQDCIRRSDLSF